jgi:hypothetical protein
MNRTYEHEENERAPCALPRFPRSPQISACDRHPLIGRSVTRIVLRIDEEAQRVPFRSSSRAFTGADTPDCRQDAAFAQALRDAGVITRAAFELHVDQAVQRDRGRRLGFDPDTGFTDVARDDRREANGP